MVQVVVVSFIAALTLSGSAITLLFPEAHLSSESFLPPEKTYEIYFPQPSPSLEKPKLFEEQVIESILLTSTIASPKPSADPSPTPFPIIEPSPTLVPTPLPSPVLLTPSPTPEPVPSPIASPTVPIPSPSPSLSSISQPQVTGTQVDEWFTRYASEYGVDRELLRTIASCESKFNQHAKNGDYGGMYQFATQTWITTRNAMNSDSNPDLRFNAEESIKTAAFKISSNGASAWANCVK